MEICVQSLPNYDIVKISGRIDSYSVPKIQNALESLLSKSRHNIVIDMQEVSYLSSSGILVFLESHRKLVRKGQGAIVFVNMPSGILTVIKIAGLEKIFTLYDNLQSAEGRFQI